jgi:hypothetical protein
MKPWSDWYRAASAPGEVVDGHLQVIGGESIKGQAQAGHLEWTGKHREDVGDASVRTERYGSPVPPVPNRN